MVVTYVDITGTGHQITITGNKHKIVIKEVALGEVWLCAGQSNMGWAVANSFGAEGEADVNLPDFRIFRSAREHWHEPLEENRDRLSRWKPCDPKSAAETSAVAYYFGKKLHEKLGFQLASFKGRTPVPPSKAGCHGKFKAMTQEPKSIKSNWTKIPKD